MSLFNFNSHGARIHCKSQRSAFNIWFYYNIFFKTLSLYSFHIWFALPKQSHFVFTVRFQLYNQLHLNAIYLNEMENIEILSEMKILLKYVF